MIIRNLQKRFGNLKLYDGLNLEIADGTVTCLLGESGSGKTTLLNIIANLCSYEGEILPKQKTSYIFQEPRLLPNLTVRGNLRYAVGSDAGIDEMLEKLEIADKADSYPHEISGGQKQRVALARAFLADTDVILMDEPFSALDLPLKLRLIERFFAIWQERKKTVIWVTHDIEEASIVANRAIVLSQGRIAADFCDEAGTLPRRYGEDGPIKQKLLKSVFNQLKKNGA